LRRGSCGADRGWGDEPLDAHSGGDRDASRDVGCRGTGSFYGDLVFTNVATSDCSFDGWPGVIAQNADGVQLGGVARIEGLSSTPVVLAAKGGVAIAALHGSMPGAYDCVATTSTTLRAYLTHDGAGAGVSVAATIPVCSDRTATLGVGPLTAA
jgi:uncharacterized protein DUF4232